jgi:hypothetical protein
LSESKIGETIDRELEGMLGFVKTFATQKGKQRLLTRKVGCSGERGKNFGSNQSFGCPFHFLALYSLICNFF